jgi:hypothetical protein
MNYRIGIKSNEKAGGTEEKSRWDQRFKRGESPEPRDKSPECGGSSSDPVWGGGANLAWPERSGLQSRSVYRKAVVLMGK